jgi:transcriptional regulator with XRE-family HTH domain
MNYNPLFQKLGKRIETLRKQKGLTQEELAEKSGFHRAYFWDIEHGRNVSLKTIYKISKALNISISDFLKIFSFTTETLLSSLFSLDSRLSACLRIFL